MDPHFILERNQFSKTLRPLIRFAFTARHHRRLMFSIRCECEKCVNSRHTEGSALARRRFYCLASVRDIGTCSGYGARRYGTDCQLLAWKRAKYLSGSRAKIRMLCRRSMKRERKPRCCSATLKRTIAQPSELSLMQCQAYSRTARTELL